MRRGNPELKGALRVVNDLDERFRDEAYRHANAGEYLESVFALTPDAKHQGLKLMIVSDPKLTEQLIGDDRFRKILLYRENELAAWSSHKIARATGQGIAGRFSEVKTTQVEFEAHEFERYMAQRERAYRKVRDQIKKADCTHIEVEYLKASTPAGRRRILEFIGANPEAGIEVHTKKRNTSEILDRFTNPGDAEAWLKANDLIRWKIEE